jgi:hypothetical protein
MPLTAAAFLAGIRRNPVNAALCARLAALALPDGWLVAGCLFQTHWNLVSGRPPAENIKDYDVFYHDDADLSYEAEDAVIRRVAAATADLGVTVEVRNQARVHLWYEARFGRKRAPIASSRAAIGLYLVACTCVGVEIATGALHAVHGLDELDAGILRPNPANDEPDLFAAKVASYRARWPWLTVAGSGRPATAPQREG